MKRAELEDEIRGTILSTVEVEGLSADDLPSDAPLFGEGVGLDSIDALEIGVALKKKFNVNFKANSEKNRERFRTISSLAAFISESAGIALED
jgi:acyl carrier protein